MSVHRPATLGDHKIQGKAIMPGAGYLEMALAASVALYGKAWSVRDMSLVEPLLLDKAPKTVQTIVTPKGPQAATVRIVSLAAGPGRTGCPGEPVFVTHAIGTSRGTLWRRSEVRGRRSEVERSEVRDPRSEVRGQN